jgi:hypothetical protein
MKTSRLFTLFAALAILAGCGQSGTSIPQGSAVQQVRAHRASGSSGDLLYVSDLVTNEVYAYNYPKGGLVLRLHGFYEPSGLCSDTNGNVFVLGNRNDNVIVYAHGSKKPTETLDLPGWALSCSVDASTGNLAVTVLEPSVGEGIAIFADAKGTPTIYPVSRGIALASCGYDDNGNLFCDGATNASRVAFFVLPKDGNEVAQIPVAGGEFYTLGHVQWDGQFMTVVDSAFSTVSRIKFEHSDILRINGDNWSGAFISATTLSRCGYQEAYQSWIYGDNIIVPCVDDTKHTGNVRVWNYPDGGNPTGKIARGSGSFPNGVTISVAPSH